MSAPSVPSPRRSYSDAMWNTYITEAIQSGNHKQYRTHIIYHIQHLGRNTDSISKPVTKKIGHQPASVNAVIVYSLTVLSSKQLNHIRLNMIILISLVMVMI